MKICRIVKTKESNGVLNISFPKEIQELMGISKGDIFEITFNDLDHDKLSLTKFELEKNNIWFIIGDRHNWPRLIKHHEWDLENDKSRDLKLFESIKPKDIILAYYKSPDKWIKHILITKQGYNSETKTIDIYNLHNIINPITYDDFNKLKILHEYCAMNRRSVVPVLPKDWNIIKNKIFKQENVDIKSKIASFSNNI